MRSPEVKKFIEERGYLFWYTPAPKGEKVTDELLVETILNYGSMDDIRGLFSVMGEKKVAEIFFEVTNRSERCRGNYHEVVLNYFTLLFHRYGYAS